MGSDVKFRSRSCIFTGTTNGFQARRNGGEPDGADRHLHQHANHPSWASGQSRSEDLRKYQCVHMKTVIVFVCKSCQSSLKLRDVVHKHACTFVDELPARFHVFIFNSGTNGVPRGSCWQVSDNKTSYSCAVSALFREAINPVCLACDPMRICKQT